MRPLILTNNINLGSTARILQSWLRLGRERGWEGCVALPGEGPLARWLADEQIAHRAGPMPWPDRRRPAAPLWHAWQLARWARRQQVDVIHCNEHDVYPFGLLLRKLLRRPLVCHVRFAVSREFCEWAFGGPHRAPDALLWTSQQQRDDCAEAIAGIVPAERQHLVRLGVNLDAFGRQPAQREAARQAWDIAPEEIVIGTASAIRPVKRIEDFVRLVARLAERHPQLVGLIAGPVRPGEEWYLQQIQAQIEATGLGRRLRWLDRVDPVEPFYQACDLFVSTSEYETFGNSVCEAMACSLPVAAYRGGSVHEVVGEAGCIVETGDQEQLLVEVEQLVSDAPLRAKLGARARQRVEQVFNPARSLDQVIAIHRQLCGDPPVVELPGAPLSAGVDPSRGKD